MWINIEIVEDRCKVIYLPASISKGLKSIVNICFGSRLVRSRVVLTDDLQMKQGDSPDNALTIAISSMLKERLFIPASQIYRMKIADGVIKLGPVIAFLLGSNTQLYNPRYMAKYSDRFGIYKQVGGLVYAFSYRSIDWDNRVAHGLYYNIRTMSWEYGKFPLPDVIYRRNFHTDQNVIKKLREVTGDRLFNSYRFDKYQMYEILLRNSELAAFLPQTEMVQNAEGIKKFLCCNKKIILKPSDLSRGRGICILENDNIGFKVIDYRTHYPREVYLTDLKELDDFFNSNPDLFRNYIMQEYIQLAEIDGNIFDIRVVMSKIVRNEWKCTGIECRVSSRRSHVTNISRGGYALELEKALAKAFPDEGSVYELKNRIMNFCFKFCNYMDIIGEHFAEFGMDIALDREKKLWFIEANVFPSFKGFKVMDYNKYLEIRYAPLIYSLYLSGFGEDDKE